MDQNDDATFPQARNMNGRAGRGTTGSAGSAGSDRPVTEHSPEGIGAGVRPGFLAELATAMRSTAEKERERISERVSEDAAAHVDKVRARAAIETDELKRLAEEDVQHIEDWTAAEMERIRAEADKKIEDRRASLEEYLKQHDTIIDTEIDGVNAAVRDYGTTLDRFFAELSEVGDPASIVARAEALPAPPDLDLVRAEARARAVALFADRDEEETTTASMETSETVAAASADTPEVGAVAAASADIDSMGQTTVASDQMSATPAEVAGPETSPETETADAVVAEAEVVVAEAEPIPVMDPEATADQTWPTPAEEPEPVEVAATVDNTSAAVRLLRSVAPWTAPTHSGSEDRTNE